MTAVVLTVLAAAAAGYGLAQGHVAAEAGKRSYWEEEHAALNGMMAESSGHDRFDLELRMGEHKATGEDAADERKLRDEIKAEQDKATREMNSQGKAALDDWWAVRRAGDRLDRLLPSFALLQVGALCALLVVLQTRPRPRLASWLGRAAWGLGALGLLAGVNALLV